MIRDVCRRLLIWIRFHPVGFASHFIVIFLILCGGGIGWALTISAVMSSIVFFASIQIDFLIPLSDGERKRRAMIKIVMMVLYLNFINLCGTMLNIFAYGRLKGDFSVGAGGIGKDLPVLAFWLIFLLLASLQQGFSFIKDQLSRTVRLQFGDMAMGEKATTALRVLPVLAFGVAAFFICVAERLLSFDFLIKGNTARNLLMAAILVLLLWDVVRLAGQIRHDTI